MQNTIADVPSSLIPRAPLFQASSFFDISHKYYLLSYLRVLGKLWDSEAQLSVVAVIWNGEKEVRKKCLKMLQLANKPSLVFLPLPPSDL